MRAVDLLGALAPLALVAGVALAASRRRLTRHFLAAGALDEASALGPPTGLSPLSRFWLARLRERAILRAAPGGRLWLDRGTWAAYRAARRRALAVLLGLALALLALSAAGRAALAGP